MGGSGGDNGDGGGGTGGDDGRGGGRVAAAVSALRETARTDNRAALREVEKVCALGEAEGGDSTRAHARQGER